MMNEERGVWVSTDRYEDLIKAETVCHVARLTYETSETYSLKDKLAVLFGPVEKPDADKLPGLPNEVFE